MAATSSASLPPLSPPSPLSPLAPLTPLRDGLARMILTKVAGPDPYAERDRVHKTPGRAGSRRTADPPRTR